MLRFSCLCLAVAAFCFLNFSAVEAVVCDAAGLPAGCTDCAVTPTHNDCLCDAADPVAAGCVTCQADPTAANCFDCTIAANAGNAACAAATPTTRRIRVTIRNFSYRVVRRIRRNQNNNNNNNNNGVKRPVVVVVNGK